MSLSGSGRPPTESLAREGGQASSQARAPVGGVGEAHCDGGGSGCSEGRSGGGRRHHCSERLDHSNGSDRGSKRYHPCDRDRDDRGRDDGRRVDRNDSSRSRDRSPRRRPQRGYYFSPRDNRHDRYEYDHSHRPGNYRHPRESSGHVDDCRGYYEEDRGRGYYGPDPDFDNYSRADKYYRARQGEGSLDREYRSRREENPPAHEYGAHREASPPSRWHPPRREGSPRTCGYDSQGEWPAPRGDSESNFEAWSHEPYHPQASRESVHQGHRASLPASVEAPREEQADEYYRARHGEGALGRKYRPRREESPPAHEYGGRREASPPSSGHPPRREGSPRAHGYDTRGEWPAPQGESQSNFETRSNHGHYHQQAARQVVYQGHRASSPASADAAQGKPSVTELKEALERERLETMIAQKRLEREMINQQWHRMMEGGGGSGHSDDVCANEDHRKPTLGSGAVVAGVVQCSVGDVPSERRMSQDNVVMGKVTRESTLAADQTAGVDESKVTNELTSGVGKGAQISSATRTDHSKIDRMKTVLLDESSDEDPPLRTKTPGEGKTRTKNAVLLEESSEDDAPPRRKALAAKGKKRTAKARAPGPSEKRKASRRCRGGRSKISAATKRQLMEAQKADDEHMKLRLLKAYEENLAELKSKNMHYYTEKDLMSMFTPKIVDHCLMSSYGKFLVRWDPKEGSPKKGSTRSSDDKRHCLSWISHENFLFPNLAQEYLSRIVNGKGCSDEWEALRLWAEDCVERERCLNCLNKFGLDEDEEEAHSEIDFCCFLCKCPWDHPLKGTIRNCEGGMKFHRGCCHGYRDLDQFESSNAISSVGRALMELMESLGRDDDDDDDEGNKSEASVENVPKSLQSSGQALLAGCQCAEYGMCLQKRASLEEKSDAVIVCINAGIAGATVSLKNLGIKISKIIHVEEDLVARHVIRSNHDFCYGETESNDGIEHVVGLYERIGDVLKDPERLVRKFGPIDLIVCSSPQEHSTEESVQYANDFLGLVEDVERANEALHDFSGNLFYLLESPARVKDHLHLKGACHCVVEQKLFVFNWPISSREKILDPKERMLGLPDDYVLHSVQRLYASLLEALCVGMIENGKSKWRDKLHPKFWIFLTMGPKGFDIKLKKGEFGMEAFLLHLKNPKIQKALSVAQYSKHLMSIATSPKLLNVLLWPMQQLFKEKNYGPHYFVEATGQVGSSGPANTAATHKPAESVSPDSNPAYMGVTACPLYAVKCELKEETESEAEE